MKRKLIMSALVFSMIGSVPTYAADVFVAPKDAIVLTVDGKPVEPSKPLALIDGSTYVSLRDMCEILGVEISWNKQTHTVNVITDESSQSDTTKIKTQAKTKTETITNKNDSSLPKITTKEGLEEYLNKTYSSCKTPMGTTKFKFKIYENDAIYNPYDYSINAEFDFSFFYDIESSIKYTKSQKAQTKETLKNHMQKIANDCIKLFPNKKIEGCYYHSYYDYPTIHEGFHCTQDFSWSNFDSPKNDLLTTSGFDLPAGESLTMNVYEQTKPSSFRWTPDLDDFF